MNLEHRRFVHENFFAKETYGLNWTYFLSFFWRSQTPLTFVLCSRRRRDRGELRAGLGPRSRAHHRGQGERRAQAQSRALEAGHRRHAQTRQHSFDPNQVSSIQELGSKVQQFSRYNLLLFSNSRWAFRQDELLRQIIYY